MRPDVASLRLEDVHGEVHDDPHHVDEVPVDAGDLEPVVMLRREVTLEGSHRRDREERETDEDVGAVQARQPEEDRSKRAVARVEPDVRVLDHLREEERAAEEDGKHEPCAKAVPVVALDRLCRPVDCEARRHENRRVDACDEDWEVVRRRGPRGRRVRVDDPHEEVDREERAEEHRLGGDEEEHPERRRVEPRAAVRERRAVVLVAGGLGVRAHAAPLPTGAPATTCYTGTPASLRRRSTTSRRSQPERSPAKVETMISSTRSSSTICIAAVYGSGWAIWPCASIPSSRSVARAARRRRSASGYSLAVGSLCGQTMRKPAGPSAARCRMRSRSRSPRTVSFAITRTLALPERAVTSETTCWNGRSPARRLSWPRTFCFRSQPDFSSGCVETISSSMSSSASTSSTAATGPPSNTSPWAGIPAARSAATIRSTRRPAVARRELR